MPARCPFEASRGVDKILESFLEQKVGKNVILWRIK
jgi:hypothetical protein